MDFKIYSWPCTSRIKPTDFDTLFFIHWWILFSFFCICVHSGIWPVVLPRYYNLCYISFISDVPSFLLVSFFFSPKNFSFFKSFSLILLFVWVRFILFGVHWASRIWNVCLSPNFRSLVGTSMTQMQNLLILASDSWSSVHFLQSCPSPPIPPPPPFFRLYNFFSSVFKFIDFLAFSILLLSSSSEFFISDIFFNFKICICFFFLVSISLLRN